MSLTRKHFIEIAEAFAAEGANINRLVLSGELDREKGSAADRALRGVAERLFKVFHSYNPRFDSAAFVENARLKGQAFPREDAGTRTPFYTIDGLVGGFLRHNAEGILVEVTKADENGKFETTWKADL